MHVQKALNVVTEHAHLLRLLFHGNSDWTTGSVGVYNDLDVFRAECDTGLYVAIGSRQLEAGSDVET